MLQPLKKTLLQMDTESKPGISIPSNHHQPQQQLKLQQNELSLLGVQQRAGGDLFASAVRDSVFLSTVPWPVSITVMPVTRHGLLSKAGVTMDIL